MAWVLVGWAFTTAQWTIIPTNFPLFFVGLFPAEEYWRPWTILGLNVALGGLSWGIIARNQARLFNRTALIVLAIAALVGILAPTPLPYRLSLVGMVILLAATAWGGKWAGQQVPGLGKWLSLAWFLSLFVVLWLMLGGLGLEPVPTNKWGGLLLTLLMTVISILLCFPLGVLMALGRQSKLPVLKLCSVIYIELVRGVPLIAILFMGQVLLPLFLPQGVRPDRILRAVVGLTLFSAAYLAENVRGGLQSIPRGQREAAQALGLNPFLVTALIIMPQALKVSIPSIVGQFISLFQDTTLLAIVGIIELLGMSRSILAQPQFVGRYAEVYLFIGVMYWFFCYAMSLGSRRLEDALNTENR
jgi:general L-amino acid transport system permease protein